MQNFLFLSALSERICDRENDRELARALSYLETHDLLLVSTPGESGEQATGLADEHESALIRVTPAGIRLIEENPANEAAPNLQAHGPASGWRLLLGGERTWVESTNATLGSIAVEGDPVVWAWLMPVLSRLFARSNDIATEKSERRLGAHADTSSVSGRYVEVDGVQAYYETCDAREDSSFSEARSAGLPILLLHTAGREGRQWHAVMERLGSTHRLYAPDLPGHGKSWPQQPKACLDEIEEIAHWLLSFMEAVGEERFIVAGTSVGGNLALLLPAISDRVVGSVAFQGSDFTPTISETGLKLMQHPRVSLEFSSMDQALSLVGDHAVPEAREMIEWSIRTLSSPPQRGDLTAYTHTDTRQLMPNIHCPVTLVHGDQDWLATRSMIDQAASRIVNSRALQVVTLPGIGHYPHIEDPDAAAGLIAEMVERVRTN